MGKAEVTSEPVLFRYCLVDHREGGAGKVQDCQWLSEAERHRKQTKLRDLPLVWERDLEAGPRWDLGYLLMALCSFHAAVNLETFGQAVRPDLSDGDPSLEHLYRQYSELVARLAAVDSVLLQAVAVAYCRMVEVEVEAGGPVAAANHPPGWKHGAASMGRF